MERFVRTHCVLQRALRVVGWCVGGAVSLARRFGEALLPSPMEGEGSGERGSLRRVFSPSPQPLSLRGRGACGEASVEVAASLDASVRRTHCSPAADLARPGHQPYCIALRAAARIFSTLGRNFISSLNKGMWVS